MNITVYLGSSTGNSQEFVHAAEELGAWIGRSGNSLVYGGSRTGLMGVLAQSALAAGAQVTGVNIRAFEEDGRSQSDLSRLVITEDLAERKAQMRELGDAFIAFPGGTGTLDEIADIMDRTALYSLNPAFAPEMAPGKPCILYNLNGYYEPLKELISRMLGAGFTNDRRLASIRFADTLEDIEKILDCDKKDKSLI